MSYPSSIDSFAGFTSSHTLSADNHASQHNSEQAGIVAVETKLGTGASTPSNNTVLRGNGAGTTTYDQVHLATDVSGTLPTSNYDTTGMLKLVYPVGCIYAETTGVNPATTFGFGVWAAYGQGRVMIGAGTSDQAFTAGTQGGESNHTLISNEMPAHTHTVTDPGHSHSAGNVYNATHQVGATNPAINMLSLNASEGNQNISMAASSTGITNNNTGGGASHNNLPPYVVCYLWLRNA